MRLIQSVLAVVPDKTRARARVVIQLERLNRLDEAGREFAMLPDLPGIGDRDTRQDVVNVHLALALRETDPSHARAMIEPLLETSAAQGQRSQFHFALAKIHDRLDNIPAAVGALETAHCLQMKQVAGVRPELADPNAKPLASVAVRVDADDHRAWPRFPAPAMLQSPIFVVGFPHSGTTLLEQTLDAHPTLRSIDERSLVQGVIERMPVRYPNELHKLDAHMIDQLRADYWSMAANATTLGSSQRIVDKNPLNLLRLPAINRVFQDAPFILALRHPCDVLLSCYLQSFRSPHFATTCRSIEQLASDYVDAMNCWIHNAELLQPRVFKLRYEDFVDDFPGHVRRIGDFLGIDDVTPMLAFNEHARRKGFISTPSYAQVIEPPHKKSIGRWRRYESLFEPVLPVLEPIMKHWAYTA